MLKIWFLYDCHVAAKISPRDREGLIARTAELFKEDGCGSVFVRDEGDGRLDGLTLHGRRMENGQYGVSKEDIETWVDSVLVEDVFRHRMHA